MGNGARAQQKRERNAKDTKKGDTSQLKSVRLAFCLDDSWSLLLDLDIDNSLFCLLTLICHRMPLLKPSFAKSAVKISRSPSRDHSSRLTPTRSTPRAMMTASLERKMLGQRDNVLGIGLNA